MKNVARASFLIFQSMIERLSIAGSGPADGSSNLPRATNYAVFAVISRINSIKGLNSVAMDGGPAGI